MIHKNEEDQKCLFLQKEYFCLRYNREGKQRMYEEFLKQIEDFIFIEDKPEKADVIFVPGNGYPQMAAHAAELWKEGFAPYVLPSDRKRSRLISMASATAVVRSPMSATQVNFFIVRVL